MDIAHVKKSLLHSSLAPGTHKAYDRFWERFLCFVSTSVVHFSPLPATPDCVSDFVAHLHILAFAPSSISSHLSAISHFHNISGFTDPCENFITRKMLVGCRKINFRSDTRKPLLNNHIQLLCQAVKEMFAHVPYLKYLYMALILTAFNGFFRLGELLPATISSADKVVQITDLSSSSKSVRLKLRNHKTNKSDKPTLILMKPLQTNCPVKALNNYLSMRGQSAGPLFLLANNSPLTLPSFREVFKLLLRLANLSPVHYKLHSFRIGACTQAILSGTPENEVMRMGRWKSNAFKRYIRMPVVNATH